MASQDVWQYVAKMQHILAKYSYRLRIAGDTAGHPTEPRLSASYPGAWRLSPGDILPPPERHGTAGACRQQASSSPSSGDVLG